MVESAKMATVQQEGQVGNGEKTQKNAARARLDTDVMPAILGDSRVGFTTASHDKNMTERLLL